VALIVQVLAASDDAGILLARNELAGRKKDELLRPLFYTNLRAGNWQLRTGLLPLHDFIDHNFAAFVDADHFVDGRVAGHRDVDNVVAGIEHHFHR
jgi:hypothetical protein